MTVFLVGAGPGDPGLLTRRGAQVLAEADVVLYDRLVDPGLLALAPAGATLIDVGKRPGTGSEAGTAPRQEDINDLLVRHGRQGVTVVRLKGGDPFVFGRGGEEAEALRDAGIAFEVVPGVTAAFAAPASAGVPVTHRGLSSSVTVVTGHVGEPDSAAAVDWESLGRAGGTLVVMMGMARRREIARRLMAAGRPADTPVLVVHWGTSPHEEAVRTTLGELATVRLGPPATIVVGAVAALDLRDRAATALAGLRVVVTRARAQSSGLADLLARAGARVVDLPVIAVREAADGGAALAAVAAQAGEYDWIAFTSANAVDRFVAHLRDGRDLGRARLAAVGGATADALGARHLVADLVPEEATAEALAEAMPVPGPTTPGRVLFPRAAEAREVLAPRLRAKGWEVTEVEAYRTVAAGPDDGATAAALDAAAAADVVTFTAPSTVARFMAAMGPRRVPGVVACIGPVTAEAARAAGLAVHVVAPDHSAAGLVAALAAHLAGTPGAPA